VTAPIAIHIVGTIFWNTAVAKKAGVDPKSWKNLDAMFADFPKIRKAGVIPLAIGARPLTETDLVQIQDWEAARVRGAARELVARACNLAGTISPPDLFDRAPADHPRRPTAPRRVDLGRRQRSDVAPRSVGASRRGGPGLRTWRCGSCRRRGAGCSAARVWLVASIATA
jgi:hypothetical protein